jgi:hypothetical protein
VGGAWQVRELQGKSVGGACGLGRHASTGATGVARDPDAKDGGTPRVQAGAMSPLLFHLPLFDSENLQSFELRCTKVQRAKFLKKDPSTTFTNVGLCVDQWFGHKLQAKLLSFMALVNSNNCS